MSNAEYARWQAYFTIEPFPALRQDRRAAEIMRAVLAAAGVKRVPKIMELLPDWWDELDERQSPEQIAAAMKQITARKRKKK